MCDFTAWPVLIDPGSIAHLAGFTNISLLNEMRVLARAGVRTGLNSAEMIASSLAESKWVFSPAASALTLLAPLCFNLSVSHTR